MKTTTQHTLLREAFGKIYEAEQAAIYRFCLLRTSDREIAHDFTQDVFVRFWKAFIEEREIKNPRTFLFTIARNHIIDWYRKKKSMSLDAMMESVDDGGSGFAPSVESRAELHSEVGYLVDKIKALAEPYRNAVYLRCVEEMKPREIAEVLGESVNVISVRISRGLKQLRTDLRYES